MRFNKIILVFILLIGSVTGYAAGDEPVLQAGSDLVSEGFITLKWKHLDPDTPVTLRVNPVDGSSASVTDIDLQGQTQVHLSGFRNGEYVARLFDRQSQPLSNETRFSVRHRSLDQALTLFSLGLALFLLLITLVIRFTRHPG